MVILFDYLVRCVFVCLVLGDWLFALHCDFVIWVYLLGDCGLC